MHSFQIPQEIDLTMPVHLLSKDEEDDMVTLTYIVRGFAVLGYTEPKIKIKMSVAAFDNANPRSIVMHIRQRLLSAICDAFQSSGAVSALPQEPDDDDDDDGESDE